MKKRFFSKKNFVRVCSLVLFCSFFLLIFALPASAVSESSITVNFGNTLYYAYSCNPMLTGINSFFTDGCFLSSASQRNFVFLVPFSSSYIRESTPDVRSALRTFINLLPDVVINDPLIGNPFDIAQAEFWFRGGYVSYDHYDSSVTLDYNSTGVFEFQWCFYQLFWSVLAFVDSHVAPNYSDCYFLFAYAGTLCDEILLNLSRCLDDLRASGVVSFDGSAFDIVSASAFNSRGYIPDFNDSSLDSMLFYGSYEFIGQKIVFPFSPYLDFTSASRYVFSPSTWTWLPTQFSSVILAFLTAVVGFGSLYGLSKLL